MTNQNTQKPTPKESMGSKIAGGFSWWIESLTGKPRAGKVPVLPQTSTPPADIPVGATSTGSVPVAQAESASGSKHEDSVMKDVEAIKNLVGKVSGKVTSKVAPVLKEGVSGTSKAASAFSQKVGPTFITKMLRVFFIILLLVILVFVGARLMRSGESPIEKDPTNGQEEVSPTPVVYNPQNASIYATDESILKLEEDINVITREFANTVLRENELIPPTLDFNVSF